MVFFNYQRELLIHEMIVEDLVSVQNTLFTKEEQ